MRVSQTIDGNTLIAWGFRPGRWFKDALETANTIRLREDYFRTCVARDDRRRYFCVFVDTAREPARLRRDRSAEPNSDYRVF